MMDLEYFRENLTKKVERINNLLVITFWTVIGVGIGVLLVALAVLCDHVVGVT